MFWNFHSCPQRVLQRNLISLTSINYVKYIRDHYQIICFHSKLILFLSTQLYFLSDGFTIKSACQNVNSIDKFSRTFKLHSVRQHSVQFSSVQSLSPVQLFATPWIAARQASLSITNSGSSLKLTSIESVMPSSHFILCRPLLLLPPIPPSIRVFSNESSLHMRWPKYWSYSFSIIPSKEIPGLIFRMDWLDLLAVQGILKSLL